MEEIKVKIGMKAVNQKTNKYLDIISDQKLMIGDKLILSNKREYTLVKSIDDTLILVSPA